MNVLKWVGYVCAFFLIALMIYFLATYLIGFNSHNPNRIGHVINSIFLFNYFSLIAAFVIGIASFFNKSYKDGVFLLIVCLIYALFILQIDDSF